jgi:hypothetical protein
MSGEGFARWLQIRDALNALDVSRKMTDAEAERIRGIAQMFRQSGYRIDHRSTSEEKSDVKIDAKEMPQINVYKSIL